MWKKLDEVLQESVRNGKSIFESNLFRVDNEIVITFHCNDVLETIIKK